MNSRISFVVTLLSMILFSCDYENNPTYTLTTRTYVVDSNKVKVQKMIQDILMTNKVNSRFENEDYDDFVEQAELTATNLYQTTNLVLFKNPDLIIYPENMTKSEKQIFERLKNE
jgi:hypothetical protein